jgi:hypothetical protein
MSKGRRIKPSTVEGRRRKTELGEIISSPRTSKAEREAAIRELDILAPVEGSGTPTKNEDSKPLTKDLLALCGRVEARRENGDAPIPDTSKLRKRSAVELDRAKSQLEPLLSRGVVTNEVRTLAAEFMDFSYGLFGKNFSDLSSAKQAARTQFQIDIWLRKNPEPTELMMKELGLSSEVGSKAESKAKPEPGPAATRPEPAPSVTSQSAPVHKDSPEPEARLGPIEKAAARAALVLQTDSWLSRLAEHTPEMRARIVAGLSDELLKVGCVSGDFAAKLYNDLRPRAVGKYPPRNF